jgi:hypothetical protein
MESAVVPANTYATESAAGASAATISASVPAPSAPYQYRRVLGGAGFRSIVGRASRALMAVVSVTHLRVILTYSPYKTRA